MAKIERAGVKLVVEDYNEFIRQTSGASGALKGLGQQAKATSAQINASSGEYAKSTTTIETWSETIDTSGDKSEQAALQYQKMGTAMTALGVAAGGLLLALGLQASRIEELGALLEVTRQNAIFTAEADGDMARAASFSSEAIQEQVQGIRDLHLSGAVANETVAQLIRYNLDWTKATDLARLAQDAATFAMQDSSEAVVGLIHGIATLQPRILRTYGLMINLNIAYRKYADANNLAVKDLTIMQRQQAAFQEVLSLAPSIAGAYEAAMSTASKQVRSLKTDIVNLSEAFGEEYTPALTAGVSATRDILHVLTDLPDPAQAFLAYATAAGAAINTIGGAALLVIPRLGALKAAFEAVAVAAGLSNAAMLGVVGVLGVGIPLLVGAVAALKQAEDARQEEAATLVTSTETYGEYESALLRADLANYKLTQSMYDTIKAHQEATDAAMAQLEAEKLIAEIQETRRVLAVSKLTGGLGKLNNYIADNIQAVTEERLALYTDADAMTALAIQAGYAVDAALEFGTAISELAQQELFTRDISRALTKEVEDWDYNARQAEEATEGLSDRQKYLAAMSYEADDALKDLVKELQEYYKWLIVSSELTEGFAEAEQEAFDKGAQALVDATTKRNRALEDLNTKYQQKSEDAWIEYQRALAESEGDLADFHAGTLNELLELDREYLRDRQDAWTTYQQDLADAERELQRDIEDANRQRVQALQDLDRQYAQDREDARRELNQDLEDIARDHADRMQDIEDDRRERSLDLEEEYQQRLYDINNYGQQRLRELQLDYQERASDARLKYLREALEQIEGGFYAADFEQVLRDLFLGLREFGPGEIPNQFRDLYAQLLKELEGLQDDQKWAEEDLSDDIDREYDQRLQDLEEWLEEEQAAIEEAYQERIAAEQQRFEDERAARQEDYDRKLEDLQRARDREREEIQRDHERRLQDIRIQAERERQELAQTYAQRLEDLRIEYDRERELIGQKLEEQNAEARKKYEEALEDIALAKQRERDTINTEFERTKTDIQNDYQEAVNIAADEFHQLPVRLQPAYDAIKTQARDEMGAWADIVLGEMRRVQQEAGQMGMVGRSPAPWWEDMASSWTEGLESGFDGTAMAANIAAAMGDIQSVIPANMASMPVGMAGSTTNTTNESYLTVNAQYQHQSEASLRDDLSLYNSMLRAYGR